MRITQLLYVGFSDFLKKFYVKVFIDYPYLCVTRTQICTLHFSKCDHTVTTHVILPHSHIRSDTATAVIRIQQFLQFLFPVSHGQYPLLHHNGHILPAVSELSTAQMSFNSGKASRFICSFSGNITRMSQLISELVAFPSIIV